MDGRRDAVDGELKRSADDIQSERMGTRQNREFRNPLF